MHRPMIHVMLVRPDGPLQREITVLLTHLIKHILVVRGVPVMVQPTVRLTHLSLPVLDFNPMVPLPVKIAVRQQVMLHVLLVRPDGPHLGPLTVRLTQPVNIKRMVRHVPMAVMLPMM